MDSVAVFANALAVAAFAGILVWAALHDCRSFRIPNRIPAALAALYPAFVATAPFEVAWPQALLAAFAVLALGTLIFSRGLLGGGDVKLMTAAMLWAAPDHALIFLLVTALAGGVLSVAALVRRRWTPALADGADGLSATSIPYGAAIAAGGVLVAALLFIR